MNCSNKQRNKPNDKQRGSEIMELSRVQIPQLNDLCPYCFGTGYLKAMQMAMTYDAGTVRTNDTKVECKHCKGKGFTIR